MALSSIISICKCLSAQYSRTYYLDMHHVLRYSVLFYIYCVFAGLHTGTCQGTCVEVRRQCSGVSSLLPQCGFQALNLGHQHWHQLFSLAEPPDWPQIHHRWTVYVLMHRGDKSVLHSFPALLSEVMLRFSINS